MNGVFWMREGEDDRRAALRRILDTIANTYGVSKAAAEIQMKKYDLLTDVRDFRKAKTTLEKYIG